MDVVGPLRGARVVDDVGASVRAWTPEEIVEHIRARADELEASTSEPGLGERLHAMRWKALVELRAIADAIEHHKGEPKRRAS